MTYKFCKEPFFFLKKIGWDSSVGIATRYGLDGPGINSGGAEVFLTRPGRPWGPPSLLYKGYQLSSPGVKCPGRDDDHLSPSGVEVTERKELHLCSPSRTSLPILGRNLPLACLFFKVINLYCTFTQPRLCNVYKHKVIPWTITQILKSSWHWVQIVLNAEQADWWAKSRSHCFHCKRLIIILYY